MRRTKPLICVNTNKNMLPVAMILTLCIVYTKIPINLNSKVLLLGCGGYSCGPRTNGRIKFY
ncbi:Uncharacterized protein APZ42_012503 [Daphnia magna]|uniref:Uncharacterized protein n=1 Tax=Daphnia magna TaxID=35525 RepID=A0A162RUX2_9CRUS|nr:Uncharacterized protein APZ42_012503 [Daphnia magna]